MAGTAAAAQNRPGWSQRGARYNFYAGQATVISGVSIARTAAFPNGYEWGGAWHLAIEGGGLSSYVGMVANTDLSGALTTARLMEAEMIADGKIEDANLSLLVQLSAVMLANTALSGDMRAFANLACEMIAVGDLTGALGLIAFIATEMISTTDMSASTLRGTASMSANMTSAGDVLTTANVAASVWGVLASAFNEPGTMGEKLNDAGAAGDPWNTLLPGAYAAGSAGDILGSLVGSILDSVVEDNGVDTLTVLQGLRLILSSATGPLSGAAGTTITIRDALDHVDRIIATVDASGNRLAVALDVSD